MKRILLSLCFLLSPYFCQASTLDILLMGGPSVSTLSNNSNININPSLVNEYKTQPQSPIQSVLGMGVARSYVAFNKPINLSLGLSGYYVDYGKIKGTEYPFINDGLYDTLNYQFRAQSLVLMVEPRLIYTKFLWQPYALVGMGVAWNHLYNYNESPSVPAYSAAASPYPFSNRTEASFAYSFALGIQRQIFNNSFKPLLYFVSVEYRYMNNGKGELGASSAQTTSDRIHITNLATQAILLSLRITV